MAREYKDRVSDTTTTAGTGTITLLAAAPVGYRSFASAGYTDGSAIRYCISSQDSSQWEVGEGTWTAATGSLSRTAVFASSNVVGGVPTLVNFDASVKSVAAVMTARDATKHKIVLRLGAAVNTTTAGWQKVPLDTAFIDTAGWFDAVNKRIMPKIEGYYQATSRTRSNNGAGLNASAIAKNGTELAICGVDTGGVIVAVEGTDIVHCDGVSDFIESWVFTSAAHPLTTGADTHLTVYGPL